MRAAARTTAPGTREGAALAAMAQVQASRADRSRPTDALNRSSRRASCSHHARRHTHDRRSALPAAAAIAAPSSTSRRSSTNNISRALSRLEGCPTASGPVSCTSRCRRRAFGRWYGRSLERRLTFLSPCGHSLPSPAKSTRLAIGTSTTARKEESPAGRAENPLL